MSDDVKVEEMQRNELKNVNDVSAAEFAVVLSFTSFAHQG